MNILGRLHQRVLNAIGIGQTTADATEAAGVQSLQIRVFGAASATKDPVPSLQDFGLASGLMPGCHVAVLHLTGDPTKGVVIASNDPRYRPAPEPGETILFNAFGMQVAMGSGGITINPNGQSVTVEGDLHVTGQVYGQYGTAGQIGLGTHIHSQGNDSHGDTEADTSPPIAGS